MLQLSGGLQIKYNPLQHTHLHPAPPHTHTQNTNHAGTACELWIYVLSLLIIFMLQRLRGAEANPKEKKLKLKVWTLYIIMELWARPRIRNVQVSATSAIKLQLEHVKPTQMNFTSFQTRQTRHQFCVAACCIHQRIRAHYNPSLLFRSSDFTQQHPMIAATKTSAAGHHVTAGSYLDGVWKFV